GHPHATSFPHPVGPLAPVPPTHATHPPPVHADQRLLPLRAPPPRRPQHQPATRNATRRERGRRGLLTPVNGGAQTRCEHRTPSQRGHRTHTPVSEPREQAERPAPSTRPPGQVSDHPVRGQIGRAHV